MASPIYGWPGRIAMDVERDITHTQDEAWAWDGYGNLYTDNYIHLSISIHAQTQTNTNIIVYIF